jgi:hypothetical protein
MKLSSTIPSPDELGGACAKALEGAGLSSVA